MKAEVIAAKQQWRNLEECRNAFENWRTIYNEQRPHESIDDEVPIRRYHPSTRGYDASKAQVDIREFYNESDKVRKVDRSGKISYLGRGYYVGTGLVGEWVAIRAFNQTYSMVSFGWKQLGMINVNAPKTKTNYVTRLPKEEE